MVWQQMQTGLSLIIQENGFLFVFMLFIKHFKAMLFNQIVN